MKWRRLAHSLSTDEAYENEVRASGRMGMEKKTVRNLVLLSFAGEKQWENPVNVARWLEDFEWRLSANTISIKSCLENNFSQDQRNLL